RSAQREPDRPAVDVHDLAGGSVHERHFGDPGLLLEVGVVRAERQRAIGWGVFPEDTPTAGARNVVEGRVGQVADLPRHPRPFVRSRRAKTTAMRPRIAPSAVAMSARFPSPPGLIPRAPCGSPSSPGGCD